MPYKKMVDEIKKLEDELRSSSTPEAIQTRIMEIARINNPRLKSVIEGRAWICANCSFLSKLGLRCGKSPCSEQFAKGFPFIENKLCDMSFVCPLKHW